MKAPLSTLNSYVSPSCSIWKATHVRTQDYGRKRTFDDKITIKFVGKDNDGIPITLVKLEGQKPYLDNALEEMRYFKFKDEIEMSTDLF